MTEIEEPRTTEAHVYAGPGRELRREQLHLQEPQAEEVLLDVVACGVCHTDLHLLKEEIAFPHPAVLGHEVSGVVRAVGDGVDHVGPGDRVVCSFIMPCGRCRHCERGRDDLCEVFFTMNRLSGTLYDGTSRLSRPGGEPVAMYSMGGHARQAVVPERAVFEVPEGVPLTDAAVLGCSLFTACGAISTVAKVRRGESVAVIAAGGVGLSMIHLARAAGAERVVAIDVDDDKLALAEELGATETINSTRADPVESLHGLLGHGADVVIEALGSAATAKLAVDLADDGGRAVLAGVAPIGQTLDVDITKVVRRKIQILGTFGGQAHETMPEVLRMVEQGGIDLERLITDRFSFDEVGEAYRALDERRIRGRGLIEIASELA